MSNSPLQETDFKLLQIQETDFKLLQKLKDTPLEMTPFAQL